MRGNPLLDAYLAGSPVARALYTGHPADPDAWRAKLAELQGRFGRAERERAAAALRPTSPAAAERLRRFVAEGGAMVTTGQQAGLFTGPLYTVLKALSAVRLAEALERELGVLVLPVFWVASEDHDFAEVSHLHAVAADGELRRLSVAPGSPLPLPMSEMPLGGDVTQSLDELLQTIGAEGDQRTYLREILAGYHPGTSVAAAFSHAVIRLFSGYDLLVADAADPALKRASAAVLLGELEHAGEHERLLAAQGERVRAAGFAPQVTLLEGATNLFWHGPAGRERLFREDGAIVAHEAGKRFTAEELRARLDEDPRVLSPNVLLRPVVESSVFPTLAYLAGPAEAAYFAQIQPLFGAFGVRAPVVYPRFGATVVPEEAAAAQQRLGVSDAGLAAPEHELWDAVARRHLPAAVGEALSALRAELVGRFGALLDASAEIDANLDPAIGARRNRALLEVARSERTILRHFKQRSPGLRRELALARNHLRPLGVPQERVLGVFQYLAREPRLLERLAGEMRVTLSAAAAPAPAV